MWVRRAQSLFGAREFAEWNALEQMEPTGPEREDVRFAMLAAVVGEALGGKGSGTKVFRQFMAAFDFDKKAKPQQTAEQMKAMLMGFTKQVTAMANG